MTGVQNEETKGGSSGTEVFPSGQGCAEVAKGSDNQRKKNKISWLISILLLSRSSNC